MMAKQIKVIKCPNCGSTQKTELKPDHYRCDNCQTEYFLDSDDININVNHKNMSTPIANNIFGNVSTQRLVIIIAAIFVIGVSIVVAIKLTESKKTLVYTSPTYNQGKVAPTNITAATVEKKYQLNYKFCSTVLVQDKPYILTLEDHVYSGNEHKFYFMVYDLLNNKNIKQDALDTMAVDRNNLIKLEHLDFTDKKTYLVANNKLVYLLDKTNVKLNDVTPSLLNNHPQYQTGIASVTLAHTTSGDALHILTNDGKKIYYYPLIDEVYLDDYDFQMVKNRPKRPPADTSTHLAFRFAERYGEDYKLIKYAFISVDGEDHFLASSARVGDFKQDGTSAKHTDADSAYNLQNQSNLTAQIVSHQNLTPGRLYFDPTIIYFDDDRLIIKTKVNAAPDANYNYQQIDITNGNVIWTLSGDDINIKQILPYQGGFITQQNCDRYTILDTGGNIKQSITLNKE